MEIRINLKQMFFISVWLLILIVALLLSTMRPIDLLSRAETFGELLLLFGGSLTLLVIGFDFLKNEKEFEKT